MDATTPPTVPQAVQTTAPRAVPREFLPALEGLRAVACLGIIVTHAAFQTGNDTGAVLNRILARTDFFVPVFFALSGFLLWRRHSADFVASDAEMRGGRGHRLAGYYVRRFARIMPAYLVVVVVVLVLFPVSRGTGPVPAAANLLLLQNYVPDGLVGGLTHLWSLCVEMFFYLVMPLLGMAVGGRSRRTRVTVIVLVAVLSSLWPFIAGPRGDGLNPHIMPWAFFGSFGVGLLAAEAEGWLRDHGQDAAPRAATVRRWAGRRYLWTPLALVVLVLASVDGPEGLTAATSAEFFRRTLCGVVFAAALVVPLALEPRSRVLDSGVMQALGRWSYSVFLWHMALLSLVFPLLGINLFSGGYATFLLVAFATAAVSVPVAAVSYSLVEDPVRRAVSRWWSGRSEGAGRQRRADQLDQVGTTTAVRHTTSTS